MQKIHRLQFIHLAVLAALPISGLLAILAGCQTGPGVKRSDALWNIISTQCLPNQTNSGHPDPCAEVVAPKENPKESHGYVILKDRIGELQYLLMPAEKITGVEAPELLDPQYPNYFALAWRERTWLAKKNGRPIPDDAVSLAVNSQPGRSQNQLHVHISCIHPEVAKLLTKNRAALSVTEWREFPGGINGHHYFAHLLRAVDLSEKNPFTLVASDLGDAKAHMADFGIALAPIGGGEEFVVLADRAGSSPGDRGSAEEIQDHSCPQLRIQPN